jgi:tetratricopeptide (TPR) repeat protein
MFRLRTVSFALALLVLIPVAAEAQRDSRYTRDATRFIGIAMTRQDTAQQKENYRQAMVHLREGMERDGDNPRVWLLAGQVLAALGELREADEAFVRAVQMYPAYAEEVATEREAAWVQAFNEGLELMDARRYDEAIAIMENAQIIYNQRPEALMNLGALYANRGETEKAIRAFQQAAEATRGPLFEQVDADTRTFWLRYREMAALNTAQMMAADGVDRFSEDKYQEAETLFAQATEMNPHARDFWFNYLQSVWAQVNALEDVIEENGPQAAAAREQVAALYAKGLELVEKTRAFDPNSEILYRIEAHSKRMQGEMTGTDAGREAGQQAALGVLERMDALQVGVDGFAAYPDGEGIMIQGQLRNRKLAPGTPVEIAVTLLSVDGSELTTTTITVNAPEAEGTTEFTGRAQVEGELAGWRYQVR